MDLEPQFWVRVLLLNDTTSCTLKANCSFSIIDVQDQTTIRNDRIGIPIKTQISNGKIVVAENSFTAKEIIIFPDKPHIFNLNGQDYRGKLKLIINSDGNSFDAINLVPPEAYLAGVIGAEMPDYWEPQALKAQAIAARTYCWYIKKHFGNTRQWDIRKTQSHQVYLGVKAESAQVWDALDSTHGKILACKQTSGTDDVFPAYYSSTCGGYTENSQYVFGDSFEPLTGVPCPYCRDVAKPKFFFWPMIQIDKTDVTKRLLERYPRLKQLGEITDIQSARQSNYNGFSRLTSIKLVGSTGKSDFLRAEDFRLTIDPSGRKLKSAIFQIENTADKWTFLSGRGFGHGVGMCQCGAESMARKSKTAEQILFYYFPNSKIRKAY